MEFSAQSKRRQVKKFQDRQVFFNFYNIYFCSVKLRRARSAEIDSNIFNLNGQLIFSDYSYRIYLYIYNCNSIYFYN